MSKDKNNYKEIDSITKNTSSYKFVILDSTNTDDIEVMEKLLEEKLNIDGLTLIQNNGDVQEVKHFHLHLKPYYNNNQEIKEVKEVYELLTK